MAEKNQLSKEEQILLQGCRDGNQEAWERLYSLCKSIIKKLEEDKGFGKLLKGANLDGEDVAQETAIKFLERIKKYKIEENISGYIIKMAWHYLKDQYRKKPFEKFAYIDEIKHDNVTAAPDSYREYEKKISIKTRNGIDKSIEHIKELYKLKKRIRSIYDKYDYVFDVLDILLETEEKFNLILGHPSAKLEEKISKYKFSSLIDSKNILNLEKKDFKILVRKKLFDFRLEVGQKILGIFILEEIRPTWGSRFGKSYFSESPQNLPLKFGRNLIKMKITPPRLMYDIWTKVNELRKGKYTDPYKIGLIFAYHKKETRGPEKEFLFRSIPDDDKGLPKAINNFLKYKDRKPSNEEFYSGLVNFIYEKSFGSQPKKV